MNTISAIFDRLNPVNILIKAGAPIGNKNAAKSSMGMTAREHKTEAANWAAKSRSADKCDAATHVELSAKHARMACSVAAASRHSNDELLAQTAVSHAADAHKGLAERGIDVAYHTEQARNLEYMGVPKNLKETMANRANQSQGSATTTIAEMNRKNRDRSYNAGSDD